MKPTTEILAMNEQLRQHATQTLEGWTCDTRGFVTVWIKDGKAYKNTPNYLHDSNAMRPLLEKMAEEQRTAFICTLSEYITKPQHTLIMSVFSMLTAKTRNHKRRPRLAS